MRVRQRWAVVLAGVALAAGGTTALAAPRVVATVAPVHSLVAGVMAGVGEPRLLIRAAASPHDFVLRPSDRRALEEAQLVFRVGGTLESFLAKTLQALPPMTRTITLSEAPGTEVHEAREGGVWAAEEHEHDAEPQAADADPRHGADPHLWLDPRNAIVWSDAIAEALGAADPANRALYRQNAQALQARLQSLEDELRAELAAVRDKPYVVFHDAYQYFEKRFGLHPVGSISVSDASAPGARRVAELRAVIRERGAVCVFSEPQFEPRLVRTVIEGSGAKSAELDPLGARLAPGPDLYFELLRDMARNLVACLEG